MAPEPAGRTRAFGQRRVQFVALAGVSARWECLRGRHVWDLEHDGRLMSPRCQRISCRRWMAWEPAVSKRQDRRGVWLMRE